jgi:hypothetical protein
LQLEIVVDRLKREFEVEATTTVRNHSRRVSRHGHEPAKSAKDGVFNGRRRTYDGGGSQRSVGHAPFRSPSCRGSLRRCRDPRRADLPCRHPHMGASENRLG